MLKGLLGIGGAITAASIENARAARRPRRPRGRSPAGRTDRGKTRNASARTARRNAVLTVALLAYRNVATTPAASANATGKSCAARLVPSFATVSVAVGSAAPIAIVRMRKSATATRTPVSALRIVRVKPAVTTAAMRVCGTCPEGQICSAGACVCAQGTILCEEQCRDWDCCTDLDCPATELCNSETHSCQCAPDCAGKTCGPDGCGGSCGECGAQQTCSSGNCVCPSGLFLCADGRMPTMLRGSRLRGFLPRWRRRVLGLRTLEQPKLVRLLQRILC